MNDGITYQKVLRFHIPMANPRNSMNIGQTPKYLISNLTYIKFKENKSGATSKTRRRRRKILNLIRIKFDIDEWHPLIRIGVMLQNAVHSLRDVFHDQIQE